MTPEEEMEELLRGVCAQSGHWPYTREADIYIGFRPAQEELQFAASRVIGTRIEYDIVIAAKRGYARETEALRYKLYNALHRAGYTLTDKPGPETYVPATELFLWPVTAAKRYAIGRSGEPFPPA